LSIDHRPTWQRWGEPLAAALNLIYTIGYMQGWAGSFVAAGIGSAVFAVVCWQRRLHAEAGLWLFYIGFAVYGWWHASDAWSAVLPVAEPWVHVSSIASAGVVWGLLTWWLRRRGEADLPGWDAFTTVGSLLATVWMVQFVHANWLYWIVVDAVAIGLYLRKQLYWGAGLMAIYTLLAVEGYWNLLSWI
jgi:nicotinamide mononucleotide transporter